MTPFDKNVAATRAWMESDRFKDVTRLYSPRQVVEQRGTIAHDYTVAREAAAAFYDRLRRLFAEGRSMTTFGPYSPGQAVTIKRMGIEGIYIGGWATSAKGSTTEDPGSDLASYPLSQVPDEAASIVRGLLAADRNQEYLRLHMTDKQRAGSPAVDYRPFIIADADTGHGGDPHVRNLIRRFVEAGVPGYHIEDQRPGTKKCGHQGGKVLVASDEQIKRLNAARFQLDVMGVPGIVVARTDAEAATLLDSRGDERDQPFILGSTNVGLPSYKTGFLALVRRFFKEGASQINGHLLYAIPDEEYEEADAWLDRTGLSGLVADAAATLRKSPDLSADALFDKVSSRFVEAWAAEAGLESYAEAVAEVMEFQISEGETLGMSVEDWRAFGRTASLYTARRKARSLGVNIVWDCEHCKTPEGYYQVRGGIDYAIAKSLAAAPFADILWMETKTANLADAQRFAQAIHAVYPDKMLAYNLSPSFNWDTTGMSDEEMQRFPEELGKLGFVFNFITYGGHQIDGVAAEEFATALKQDGMLALARLQRKIRLLESPYRTPQTLWADRAWTPRWPRRRAGRPRPRPWARARRSTSIWYRPRCRQEAARGVAGHVDGALPAARPSERRTPPTAGRFGAARTGDPERGRRQGGQRGLRAHPGPPRSQHPLRARPEHLRRNAPQEAADDAHPPLPGPPLPGGLGALRDPDGRQPVPDRKNEKPRHLQRGQHGGRPDHRRRREPCQDRRASRTRPRHARQTHPEGKVMGYLGFGNWDCGFERRT